MSDQNPIDQLFKERLEKHQLSPSEGVWEKVQAAQPKTTAKAGGWFVLRAATVALLIGLNAMFYFTNHEVTLSSVEPLAGPAIEQTEANNNPTETPSATEPKKGTSTKKAQPAQKEPAAPKSKKEPAKVIPALSQPSKATQIFVDNALPVAKEAALTHEQEEPLLASVALNKDLDLPYTITIRDLPETRGYYGKDTAQVPETNFSDKLWAYASTQVNRLLAGEKPQLPKTNKTPQLAIALPKFLYPTDQP